MTTNTKPKSVHAMFLRVAKSEVKHHIEYEDGEKCFNRYTFLNTLASRIDAVMCHESAPVGRFELNPTDVARYLYCCLCTESGDACDGMAFRGMPILD